MATLETRTASWRSPLEDAWEKRYTPREIGAMLGIYDKAILEARLNGMVQDTPPLIRGEDGAYAGKDVVLYALQSPHPEMLRAIGYRGESVLKDAEQDLWRLKGTEKRLPALASSTPYEKTLMQLLEEAFPDNPVALHLFITLFRRDHLKADEMYNIAKKLQVGETMVIATLNELVDAGFVGRAGRNPRDALTGITYFPDRDLLNKMNQKMKWQADI